MVTNMQSRWDLHANVHKCYGFHNLHVHKSRPNWFFIFIFIFFPPCTGLWEDLHSLCLYFLSFLCPSSITQAISYTEHPTQTSPVLRLICGVIPLLPMLYEGVSSALQAQAKWGLWFLLTWCWNAPFSSPLLPRQPSSRCLRGKFSSCRPQGASTGECTLCITQQSKQRQRNTDRLSPLTGRREPYC